MANVGAAIASARRAIGLTQTQLGMRLGLKGRALSRWEVDRAKPTRRNQRALVIAIQAVDMQVAARLAAALAAAQQKGPPPVPQPPAPPPVPKGAAALEMAIFQAADELDLPPRKLRAALARLFERMRTGEVSLELAKQQLDAWLASGP